MKKIVFLIFFSPLLSNAQEYVDLLKIGYGQTFNNDFEGTNSNTFVKSFEGDLTVPLPINDNNAVITGLSFSRSNLQLFPNANYTSLYSTTLKLGLATNFSEKWSGTFVLLPKIASDYEAISSNDFYVGGFALLKLQKKENLIYRFGIYGSTEAFGFFTTPILGWYYLSDNKKFEMDVSLPIATDINYNLGIASIGLDYYGIGRSFNIQNGNNTPVYVDLSSLEFASYLQFNALEKSVLIRAKLGYASSNYEVYAENDTIDLGLSAFSFGDNRTLLNPTISGGVFLKFEAIYRFHISNKKEEIETPLD